MAKKSTENKLKSSTLEWIERHPELIGHLERLQEISEDPDSDLETLEAAEKAVIDEIDRLGGEALRQWMQRREREVCAEAGSGRFGRLRRHSKKNSG